MKTWRVYNIARSVAEIELINRCLDREKIPARAYRLGSRTNAQVDGELTPRQEAELEGLILDPDIATTWQRNLPPIVQYVVTVQTTRLVRARCTPEAMASIDGAISAIPAWLNEGEEK